MSPSFNRTAVNTQEKLHQGFVLSQKSIGEKIRVHTQADMMTHTVAGPL